MTDTEKYLKLIRELIAPSNWRLDIEYQYAEVHQDDREKCVQAGIKRFDELWAEGRSIRSCTMAADHAVRGTAKKLHEKRMRALDAIAPKIQERIRELIQDKDPGRGFDLGYEVAATLKAEGYSWDQVIVAKRGMKLPGKIDDGIQIGYTGKYD